MKQDFINSQDYASALNILIITLENCDGIGWNRLMEDLFVIYEKTSDPVHSAALASSRCSAFVRTNFWKAFPDRSYDYTVQLMNCRFCLIAGASAAIAAGARVELDLRKTVA